MNVTEGDELESRQMSLTVKHGNLIGHNRGETREDRTGKEDVCYKLNIFFIERDQPCDNESQCEENMFSPVFSQKFDSSKNSIIEF